MGELAALALANVEALALRVLADKLEQEQQPAEEVVELAFVLS